MKANGFTLVELITIMIILGILSAYAAPRFFSSGDTDVVAAEVGLASLLRAQQQRAMQDTANQGYGVNIETAGDMTIFRPVNQNAPVANDSRRIVAVASSISVQADVQELRFNASGCIEQCGLRDITVILVGQTSRSVCINRQGFISQGPCQTS